MVEPNICNNKVCCKTQVSNGLGSLRKTPAEVISPIVPGPSCDNLTQTYNQTNKQPEIMPALCDAISSV